MSRFVNREASDLITLGNGDTVQVRQALSAREDALLRRNLFRWEFADGNVRIADSEWYLQHIEVCKAYVLDWSFADDQGRKLDYRPELIDDLDADTVQEIAAGIDGLQAQRRVERTKKGLPTSTR
ncbi:MAG: hypothetical protein ABIH03_01330 [Pseudomonadota bacterium]